MARLIIDVREPKEYDMGHVEGALNMPPAEIMGGAPQLIGVNKDTELVLYCNSGSRSKVAGHFLRGMGFSNVVNGINKDHVSARYGYDLA